MSAAATAMPSMPASSTSALPQAPSGALLPPTSLPGQNTLPLDAILADRGALDCFRAWMNSDLTCANSDSLDLYFAIIGFKRVVESGDFKAAELACHIHKKFISQNSGTCDFIPPLVRKESRSKVVTLKSKQLPVANLFDAVESCVWSYLHQRHQAFVASPEYNDLVTRYANGFVGQDDIDQAEATGAAHATNFYVNDDSNNLDRMGIRHPSASVIASSVGDQPEASTSDIGLETSFSGLKLGRQAASMTTSTSDGRYRLTKDQSSTGTDDGMLFTTMKRAYRQVGGGGGHRRDRNRDRHALGHQSGMRHEREEDRIEFARILTNKLNEIAGDVLSLEHIHGKIIYAREIPNYKNVLPMAVPAFEYSAWGSHGPVGMTTSAPTFVPVASNGFDADEDEEDLSRYEEKMHRNERSNSISPAPQHKKEAVRYPYSPYGSNGFAPPPPPSSNKSGASRCTNNNKHQPTFAYMPQAAVGNRTTYVPKSAMSYLSYSDSSGVFSAESAFVCHDETRKKLFEKARENNAQSDFRGPNTSQTLSRKGVNHVQQRTHSSTLPRSTRVTAAEGSNSDKGSNANNLPPVMTVTLRQEGKAPYVYKLDPPRPITLAQFREMFLIGPRSSRRIFFKSVCEDGDDPYQWTAVEHDDDFVPIFDGKITAECRTMCDFD